MLHPLIRSALVWSALAAGASAPAQQPEDNAGFGGVYRTVDLQQATGNARSYGCAVVGSSVFVSAQRLPGTANHLIYQFDAAGVLLGYFLQPVIHAATAWGMRDLCTDGTHIAGGSEAGISILAPDGSLATTWHGQPIAQPITGQFLTVLGVPRGLAWDGTAAGGAGRFYAVDFDSPLVEFDVQGNVTATFPNQGWSGTGLALDASTGNLWVATVPARGRIAEIDRTTGMLTGRTITPARPGSAGGGLSEAGCPAGSFAPWPAELVFAAVLQGEPDLLTVQRVHLQPQILGWNDVRLDIGVNAAPGTQRITPFGFLDTLTLRVTDPTSFASGWPCWTILNLPPESATDGITDLSPFGLGLGLLVEHRTRNIANTGTPTLDFLILDGAIDATTHIPLNAGILVSHGMLLRAQTLYLDLVGSLGMASTNEAYWVGSDPQTGVIVEAVGPDSFERDLQRGFWRVRHLGGYGAIEHVTLDWTGASIERQRATVFDIDQERNGFRHDGGNATAGNCRGTYRNGSDVAAGLDYSFPGNHAPPCALAGENSGFTIDVGDATAAQRLTYRFAGGLFVSGVTFEFDCDTDGGLGVAGSAMRGLYVQVQIAGGPLLSGHLASDDTRPLTAYVRL